MIRQGTEGADGAGEMKLLVILQNAYSHDGEPMRRRKWLLGLWRSYSGKRLREMLPQELWMDSLHSWPEDRDYYICNATEQWANDAIVALKSDPEWLARIVAWLRPDYVLACGRVAQRGLDRLGISYIEAPHPAWRALTKERTAAVRAEVLQALGRSDVMPEPEQVEMEFAQ